MRGNINRFITMMTFLATVGSFVIAFWQFHYTGEVPQDSPVTSGKEGPPPEGEKECKLEVYEAAATRLRRRSAVKRKTPKRPVYLGRDTVYDYYYSHVSDQVYCSRHNLPDVPQVEPAGPLRKEAKDWTTFWICVAMVLVCFTGLAVIRNARANGYGE